LQEFDARVHPNPTRGYFALQVTSSNGRDPITLQVFDQLGRHIETRTVAQGLTDRIGTNYIPGVYYFRVTQGQTHKELKVLKLPN
jgi:hypothetical protein